MKYPYSSTANFQNTPNMQGLHAHRPSFSSIPPPPPPRPDSQYAYSAPQLPPTPGSLWPVFGGVQLQSPYSPHTSPGYGHQPQSPPPFPTRPGYAQYPSTGYYTPGNYDIPPNLGYTPEEFYGSLIDTNNRPSEVLSRLADALFSWLDQNCDIPGLRGTGVIEPAKYAWMSAAMGAAPDEQSLSSFYEMASIPHQYIHTHNGQVPVVDRRGWLHLMVFKACASPDESHQHWNKALSLFPLVDPLTNSSFPTPLPRTALPAYPDPALHRLYMKWRTQTTRGAPRAHTHHNVQDTISSGQPYRPHAFTAGAGAGGFGAPGTHMDAYGGQGGDNSTFGGWGKTDAFGDGDADDELAGWNGNDTFGDRDADDEFAGWNGNDAFGGGDGSDTFGDGCGNDAFAGFGGNSGGGVGGSDGGSGGNQATMMDTVNTLGTLANTIICDFEGGTVTGTGTGSLNFGS